MKDCADAPFPLPHVSFFYFFIQVIEQEAIELKNKFSSPRRSMLEDTDSGQLEDIDVIPNEEMLLVHEKIIFMIEFSCLACSEFT